MEEMKPPVAGMQSRGIYEPFCNYVMETDKVIFAVAEIEEQIIGFSITIIDYKRFWRKFFTNHILLSIKVVFKKFVKLLKHNRSIQLSSEPVDISKYLSKHNTNRSWKDSSPIIGKVLYIAVKKDYRQKGIGKGLYKFRHKILLQKGVKRVDGKK
ncbi:MAG: GNAT family N-acetyltransferase [Desulfosarcina sp.]|nr:GNAT family N-acetyltransferase [Desulfosarcina sp.]